MSVCSLFPPFLFPSNHNRLMSFSLRLSSPYILLFFHSAFPFLPFSIPFFPLYSLFHHITASFSSSLFPFSLFFFFYHWTTFPFFSFLLLFTSSWLLSLSNSFYSFLSSFPLIFHSSTAVRHPLPSLVSPFHVLSTLFLLFYRHSFAFVALEKEDKWR